MLGPDHGRRAQGEASPRRRCGHGCCARLFRLALHDARGARPAKARADLLWRSRHHPDCISHRVVCAASPRPDEKGRPRADSSGDWRRRPRGVATGAARRRGDFCHCGKRGEARLPPRARGAACDGFPLARICRRGARDHRRERRGSRPQFARRRGDRRGHLDPRHRRAFPRDRQAGHLPEFEDRASPLAQQRFLFRHRSRPTHARRAAAGRLDAEAASADVRKREAASASLPGLSRIASHRRLPPHVAGAAHRKNRALDGERSRRASPRARGEADAFPGGCELSDHRRSRRLRPQDCGVDAEKRRRPRRAREPERSGHR